jgi:uncharacterized protein YfaS (alpha-2-macroglobulin family)
MSGEDQTLSLVWTLNGGLKANGELPGTLSLKNGEEQWLTLPLTVTGASGVASLQLAASGKDFAISRDWTCRCAPPGRPRLASATRCWLPAKRWLCAS